MKHGVNKKSNKELLFSFTLVITAFLLFIFTDPKYTSSGDQNIAEFLSSTSKAGFFYISPFLSKILRIFISIFPTVNWWTIFSIIVMFSCLGILSYLIQKLVNGVFGKIITLIFCLFMWCNMIGTDINFTQTAELSAMTGFMLILCKDIFTNKWTRICCNFFGIMYILIAGGLRTETLLICLPFAVMGIGYRFVITSLENREAGKKIKINVLKQIMLPISIIILVIVGIFVFQKAETVIDPYWGEYVNEYENERSIYDYSDRYPSWDEGQEQYEAAGIKRSWFNMAFQYYIEDFNYFKAADMQKLINFKVDSQSTGAQFISSLKEHIYVWPLLIIIVLFMSAIVGIKRSVIPFWGNLFAFFLCSIVFIKMGRFTWQTTSGVILSCTLLFIYMCTKCYSQAYIIPESKLNHWRVLRYLFLTILLLSSVMVFGVSLVREKTFAIPSTEVISKPDADLLDYMDDHQDIIYYMENKYYSCNSIWKAKQINYLDNLFTIFSNFNRGRNDDFVKTGIGNQENFIPYLLTRSNVYSVYDDTFISYLCDYYNPYVSIGIVDEFDETNTEFVRYVAPISIDNISNEDDLDDIVISIDTSKEEENYQVISLSAYISGEEFDEYYLNVVDDTNGAIYSYPLVIDGGEINGLALWRNNTWDFGTSRRSIVGKKGSKYVELEDITEIPVPFE